MKKYKVTLVRIEHTIHNIEVMASNPDAAEELAQELWDDGEYDSHAGEVVYGEEYINQVDELKV